MPFTRIILIAILHIHILFVLFLLIIINALIVTALKSGTSVKKSEGEQTSAVKSK